MNKWQEKAVNDAPSASQATLTRAYAGRSRNAAIRAFCMRCVGYARSEVRDCTSWACPLHPYRPYQRDDEPDDLPDGMPE